MQRQSCEIADIIRRFAPSFIQKHNPNTWQLRTIDALSKCRTAALGGHKYKCNNCGKEHISYNSCRNRHCPKCQGAENSFWIEDRTRSVLPLKHYHIVFTVPETLNRISLLNSRWFYNLMFKAVWETLRQFGYTHYGIESGAIATLHTYGQNLSLHPHIHCIVPTAGLGFTGKLKYIGKKGNYLFPVRSLSHVFRSKFMQGLQKHPLYNFIANQYEIHLNRSWKKHWVVYCEPSFGKPEHVIGYLAQYIHRVAITNNRILKITKTDVTFRIKDYRDDSKAKLLTLCGEEFLRRFCLHILPKRFVKTRYYGIYHNRFCNGIIRDPDKIEITIPESRNERIKRLTGYDLFKCPTCKIGKLVLIEVIPKARLPSAVYNFNQNCNGRINSN